MKDVRDDNPFRAPAAESAPGLKRQPALLPEGQHEYLLTGRNPRGRKVTERVTAESCDAAVELFRQRGYAEIVLHTDEASALYPGQSAVAKLYSPRAYIKQRNAGNSWRGVWLLASRAYTNRWIALSCAMFLVLLIFRRTMGRDWSFWDWTMAAYLFFPLALAVWVLRLSAVRRYHRLFDALAWGRWEEALRLTERLRGRVPDHELLRWRARALAGQQRMDEALRALEELAHHPLIPEWLYQELLRDVYLAGDRVPEAIAAGEKAGQLAPGNADLRLSLAVTLLGHTQQTERARQLLDSLHGHALSEFQQLAFRMARGVLALADHEPHQAQVHLDEAFAGIAPFRTASPLVGVIEDLIHACLAQAAAGVGDLPSARRHFRKAEPRLRALDRKELLARCHEALEPAGP